MIKELGCFLLGIWVSQQYDVPSVQECLEYVMKELNNRKKS